MPLNTDFSALTAMANAIKNNEPKLLQLIGTHAVNFSKENFRMQRFNAPGSPMWANRKNDKDVGRGILIGKGTAHLRNSIHIVSIGPGTVTIGTGNLPYAQVHNEGFQGTVQVHPSNAKHFGQTFQRKMNMPQRQYMGESPIMNAELKTIILNFSSSTFKIIR